MAEKKESAKSTREKAAEARAAAQASERRRERTIRIVGGVAVLAVVAIILGIGWTQSKKDDTPAPDANSALPTGVTWTKCSGTNPIALASQTAGKYVTVALVNKQTGYAIAAGSAVEVVGA